MANSDVLLEYLRQSFEASAYYPGETSDGVNFSPAPPASAAPGSIAGTNLQVQGVDEPDVVKTNGTHLYTLSGSNTGADEVRLTIYSLGAGEGEAPSEVNSVLLDDLVPQEQVRGILLYESDDASQKRLAVITGGEQYFGIDIWWSPYYFTGETGLLVFDLADPEEPELLSNIVVEGSPLAARRIGSELTLVTRFVPGEVYGAEAWSGIAEDLIAKIFINGDGSLLTDPSNVFLPPMPPEFRYLDQITISSLDLENPTHFPDTSTIVGAVETVHVSTTGVYLASSRYGHRLDPNYSDEGYGEVFTDLHYFKFTQPGTEYFASGAVKGALPWGGLGPAFALGEHDNHLRVLTESYWGEFDGLGDFRVSVLRLPEDAGGEMVLTGFVPDADHPDPIGKPGETVYGVRFLQERAYTVTFEKVDPLYVIDLSRPFNPKVLGDVEVPGFSDYLHPIGDNFVVGVGKDAKFEQSSGITWFQGLQVSLFDVSNPAQPKAIDQQVFGRRGSSSQVLDTHRAFSFLSGDQSQGIPARFAIPVRLHDVPNGQSPNPSPNYYYPWQASGSLGFALPGLATGAPVLDFEGFMVTDTPEAFDQQAPGSHYLKDGQRVIVSSEGLYYWSEGLLHKAFWGSLGSSESTF